MPDVPNWVTLTEGERLVWRGHPSPVAVAQTLVVGVVLAGVGVAAGVTLAPPLNLVGVAVLFLGVAVMGAAFVRQRATTYVVTTEEVYAKRGLFSRHVSNVRLDRVQNTGFTQSLVQRLVGVGDVRVDTAGTDATEFVLADVPDPQRVNGTITEHLERRR